MTTTRFWWAALGVTLGLAATVGMAAPLTYVVDPSHTFPSFEADHWGGLSVWRGKVNRTEGVVVFDREAETGTIDVTMDMASIDFGHDGMNERAIVEILEVDKFPNATYTGRLTSFRDGQPTGVEGTLTIHGVSKAVNLQIDSFRCQPHHRLEREVCGSLASTTINRADYGLDYDLERGFFPEVKLFISVEALAEE